MPENEDGRPVAGGAGAPAQQAGETFGNPTAPIGHLAGWHAQAEFENAWHYAEGWAAGYAAGWQAVADEVRRATGVRPYTAREVIAWLCRQIDLDHRQPEPYSSPENGTTLTVQERDVFGRLAA